MNEFNVAAIDLGSFKITGAVAKKSDEGIELLAVEEEPTSGGIIKGRIKDTDAIVLQMNRILKKLCNVTGIKAITSCYVVWQNHLDDTEAAKILEKKMKTTKLIFPSVSSIGMIAQTLIPSDERETGCIAIDFGDTATSYTYIENQATKIEKVIPGGSSNITKDLMSIFNYDFKLAETLKLKLGKAIYQNEPDRYIQLSKDPNNRIRHSELSGYISQRVDDIFKYVLAPLQKNHWNSNRSRIIYITGGGSALQQMEKYLNTHTGLTSKTLKPRDTAFSGDDAAKLLNPKYTALAALILSADKRCDEVIEKQGFFTRGLKKFINKGTNTTKNIFEVPDEEKF